MRMVLISLTVLVVPLPGGPRQATSDPTAIQQIDRYVRGEHHAVLAELSALSDVGDVLSDLQREGRAWIDAGGPAQRSRRQLAAATFALEAARVADGQDWKWVQQVRLGMGLRAPLEPPDMVEWKAPARLVEWGCALLRDRDSPQPIERIWQLAALAVAQRRGDYEFLIGSPWDARGNPEDEINHLSHASGRFPNEPRFVLAQAIAIDWHTWPWHPRRQRLRAAPGPEATRAFETLLGDEAVGAEAMVRLGVLRFRSRNFDGAAEMFRRADEATRDPYLVYLARYFTGQARDQQQRPEDAERAYRAALAAVPRATSATMALAALLAKADRRAEASEIVEAGIGAGAVPIDPWRTYAAADDRFWPELIGQLREAIRP